MSIEIYTDGSCHTQQCVGAWVSILLVNGEKIILSGTEKDTTHNRMELKAVIKAIEYVKKKYKNNSSLTVVSDSQYVVGLNGRRKRLVAQNFNSVSGKEMTNADLVKEFFKLSDKVTFVKIKAHQKKTAEVNYNIEADLLVRKLMREIVL